MTDAMTRVESTAAVERRHLVFFSDCPYFGGAEGYLVMLAQGRPGPEWRLSALVPEGERGEVLAGRMRAAGVDVVRYPVRGLFDPRHWAGVAAALRSLRGGVLHLNLPSVYDARLSTPAILAKLCGYRRVVTTEHLPMVPRARRRLAVKTLLAPAIDAIIVNTEWNREKLARYHHMPRRKIVVVPNGSPDAPSMSATEREALRRKLNARPEEVAITVAARLTERKGHRFLFEALARLTREGLNGGWRLWVVGDGEEEARLRSQVRELGLAERVEFLGYRGDVREIMHASDMLALASTLETQPFVLPEAMASCLPIVATGIYGVPEIVADGETGLLVPPAQIEPLAQALGRLIRDAELRRRMGTAGRRRYEESFRLEIMAARTYGVFRG
jgi:glycosyltransferase involved in cell wall biosynthesis